ncbi:MAG: hypothetical protein PHI79_08410 [Sulfurovaceae bacterium]|nr:hypothetical protein [Sulfurovaceae bacterium]MDD5549598.1 hypothetical protein [Sulfurovaceae bacterium]
MSSIKSIYRGIEIKAVEDVCLGGWSTVDITAITKDGFFIVSSYTEEPLEDAYNSLKYTVDDFIDNFNSNEEKWSKA